MKCIATKFFKNIGKINSAPTALTAPETEDKCASFEEFMDSDEDTCGSNCFEEFMSSDDSTIVDSEPDIVTDSETEAVIIEEPEAVLDETPEPVYGIVSNLPASSMKVYDVCRNVMITYRVPCKTCGEKFKNGDIIRFDPDGSIHHADCKFGFGDPLFMINDDCKDGIFETKYDAEARKILRITTAVMQNDVSVASMEDYLDAYDKYLTEYLNPDRSNLVNDNGLYQKKQNAKKRKKKTKNVAK